MKLRELDRSSNDYKVNILSIYYREHIVKSLKDWNSSLGNNTLDKAIIIAKKILQSKGIIPKTSYPLGILISGIIESVDHSAIDKEKGVLVEEKILNYVEHVLGEEIIKSSEIECTTVTEENWRESRVKAGVINGRLVSTIDATEKDRRNAIVGYMLNEKEKAGEDLGVTLVEMKSRKTDNRAIRVTGDPILNGLLSILRSNKSLSEHIDKVKSIEDILDYLSANMHNNETIAFLILNYITDKVKSKDITEVSACKIEEVYTKFIEELTSKSPMDTIKAKKLVEDIKDLKFKTSQGNRIIKENGRFVIYLSSGKENEKHELTNRQVENMLIESISLTKVFMHKDVNFGPGKIVRSNDTSNEIIKLIQEKDYMKSFITDEEPRIRGFRETEDITINPIGVVPRDVWIEKRRKELKIAIADYSDKKLEVPEEWNIELKLLSTGKEDTTLYVEKLLDELIEDGHLPVEKRNIFRYLFIGAIAHGLETAQVKNLKENNNNSYSNEPNIKQTVDDKDSFITDSDYLYQFAKSKMPPALLRDESKNEREIVIDFVKQDILKKAYGCTK